MLKFNLKPLDEAELDAKATVKNLLEGMGFEVSDHRRMIYAKMENNNLLLQLSYFTKHRAVSCHLSGFGLYTQLFGEYVISTPEELGFLLKSNKTITNSFPQLRQ